jgi:hypothetical protein
MLSRSTYIASPAHDWVFFLLPPMASVALGIFISGSWFSTARIDYFGSTVARASLFLGIFVHAHIVSTVFRSHGNPSVFRLHRWRFVLAPLALWVTMMTSMWVLIGVWVLATFWDVYHSALQTFGFARIYDNRAGNDAGTGRRLDWLLNHLLYAGPILAGVTMIDHFGDFHAFDELTDVFFTGIPVFMDTNQRYFAWAVLLGGTAFVAYYLFTYWRLQRDGHRISGQKVFLLASTGLCSIYT